MAFTDDKIHSFFGHYNASVEGDIFSVTQDDRRRHVYIIGQTGTGKTTLLETLILQDIHAGRGVCLIDPHGDIAKRIANSIPRKRIRNTIYFDPSDKEFPIGFNPLANVPPEQRELVASSIVQAFKGLWGDSWGEWLEYLLKNSILALLHYRTVDLSLIALPRFLSDASFREKVLRHCNDPVIMDFWDNWFNDLDKREELSRVISTLNKAGKLSLSPTLRNILGQGKNGIDFKRVMDEKKILIINLSKGLLGSDNSNLLGSLIVSHLVSLSMRRALIDEEERVDHHLYIDEFQNFTTKEFETILSEARKYRLNLTVCHQYLKQIDKQVLDAVLGNVGMLTAFSISADDAEHLAGEYTPFPARELTALSRGTCFVRYRKNGDYQTPQLIKTFKPTDELHLNSFKRVRNTTRNRHASCRNKVERTLQKFYDNSKP